MVKVGRTMRQNNTLRRKTMLYLLSSDVADTSNAGGNTGGGLGSLMPIIMIVVMIAVFYFFMIRPQKKQEREAAAMRNGVAVGDEITTIGGVIGKVISVKEETILIETSGDRTKIRFLKSAIRSVDVKAEDAQD